MNLIAMALAVLLLVGVAWLEGAHTTAMSRRRRNKPDKEGKQP